MASSSIVRTLREHHHGAVIEAWKQIDVLDGHK
jgi:hypothetical protein